MYKAGIIATGTYLPDRKVTREDFIRKGVPEKVIDEWGVLEHRVCADNEKITDMHVNSSLSAIKNAGLIPEEIELVICSSFVSQEIGPPDANLIQYRIGAKNAAAFNVDQTCCSVIPQLITALCFVEMGLYKYVLVAAASNLSRIHDPSDWNGIVFLGDGAGAAIIGRVNASRGYIASDMQSNGKYYNKCGAKITTPKNCSDLGYLSNIKQSLYFYLDTPDTSSSAMKKYVLSSIPDSSKKTLKKANLSANDVNFLLMHQNIKPLYDAWRKKIGIPEEMTYSTYHKYGSISSANILVNMHEATELGKIKDDDIVLLASQGAGFSVGSIALKWGV